MRTIIPILLLLCLVVSPVFAHSAMDVEGTTDDLKLGYDYYKEIVQYAATQQDARDYPATYHLKPSADEVIDRLQKDNLFFFNGHCSPGKMGISENQGQLVPPTWIFAKNRHGPQLDNLLLTNLDFIFFDCCESAGNDALYGNLVKTAVQRGAKCAFGFRTDLRRFEPAILYGQSFWNEARMGKSWLLSHQIALEELRHDPKIKKRCDENPVKNMCGYETLEYQPTKGDACRSYMQSNPVANETVQPSETMIQPINLKAADLTLDQAQDIIREFTGNPNLKVKYENRDDNINQTVYGFTSDDETFFINSVTHRVEDSDRFASWDLLDPTPERNITLDGAYVIAENLAKKQYPQLWNTTDETGMKVGTKYRDTFGDGRYKYIISFEDEYYYPDKNAPGYITIGGLNSITIEVAPGSEIYSYLENLTIRDESVSLKPDLTEEQAWDIAKAYLLSENHTQMMDDDKTSFGLMLTPFSNPRGPLDEKQTLTWNFDTKNEQHQGAYISIDAHDGHVVNYLPIF